MKKKSIAILALLFFFLKPYAQFTTGLNLGLNFCTVKDGLSNDNSTLIGMNTGLFTQYSLDKKFFLNTGLQYSSKGYNAKFASQSTTTNMILNYISIPTLIGFSVTNNLAFLFGPEFNYLTSAKSKNDSNKSDITDDFKKFDIGLDLAIKSNFSKRFGVELRYNYGLSKIQNVTIYVNGQLFGSSTLGNNRVFQINLFYTFKK